MRAWQLSAAGIEHLNRVELPDPEPGEREVVVRMKAASLNYRDWMIASGTYRMPTPFPIIPLSDGAGEIIKVGKKAKKWKVGDRVASSFFAAWLDGLQTKGAAASALGGAVDGVLAEQVVLSRNGIVRTPDHLSDVEAATLPCAALTAWHALYEGADPLRPGQTVLLEGTGGVSIFGLQLAKLGGARVIITSSSDDKLARAKALGADEVVNYAKNPEWQEKVKELTHGEGVDHVLEIGGKDTLPKALASLRYGGQLHLIGGVSGFSSELPLGPMAASNLRVRRIYVGSVRMFEAMNRALSLHQVKPVIDRTFSFDAAKDALADLKKGSHFGKIAITF